MKIVLRNVCRLKDYLFYLQFILSDLPELKAQMLWSL